MVKSFNGFRASHRFLMAWIVGCNAVFMLSIRFLNFSSPLFSPSVSFPVTPETIPVVPVFPPAAPVPVLELPESESLEDVLLESSSQDARPNISFFAFFAALPAAVVFFAKFDAAAEAPDILLSASAAIFAVAAMPSSLLLFPVSISVNCLKIDASPTIFFIRALTC